MRPSYESSAIPTDCCAASGTNGKHHCIRFPSKNNGNCGPGTLVTTRLNILVTACSRAACATSVGGAKSPSRESECAPMAWPLSFSPFIASRTLLSRSSGFDSVTGKGQKTAETWLPNVPFCSSVRTLTGTSARRSADGGAPRSVSQVRSPPATVARITSLTVPPSAARTSFTSLKESSTISKRRCGPIGTFKGDSGARPIETTSSSGLRPEKSCPKSFTASLFGSNASRTMRSGCVICSFTDLTSSSETGGAWRGVHDDGKHFVTRAKSSPQKIQNAAVVKTLEQVIARKQSLGVLQRGVLQPGLQLCTGVARRKF